jgi:hypothetical protein
MVIAAPKNPPSIAPARAREINTTSSEPAVAVMTLASRNTRVKPITKGLRGRRSVAAATSGPPIIAPSAKLVVTQPASDTETPRSSLMSGSRPLGTSSAVPRAKAVRARAMRGGWAIWPSSFGPSEAPCCPRRPLSTGTGSGAGCPACGEKRSLSWPVSVPPTTPAWSRATAATHPMKSCWLSLGRCNCPSRKRSTCSTWREPKNRFHGHRPGNGKLECAGAAVPGGLAACHHPRPAQ